MNLYESELFIALVLENLAKQSDIVIFSEERFDAVNQSCCPLDDQVFKTVALVEVRIHVLLHGLSRQLALFTLLVILHLLRVHVVDKVFKLF